MEQQLFLVVGFACLYVSVGGIIYHLVYGKNNK